MGHVFAYVFERFVREGEREGGGYLRYGGNGFFVFLRHVGGRHEGRRREEREKRERRSDD